MFDGERNFTSVSQQAKAAVASCYLLTPVSLISHRMLQILIVILLCYFFSFKMYNITARITHFMGFSRLDSLDKGTTNASSAHVLRNTYTILRITCTHCADVQLTKWELETIATAASVRAASHTREKYQRKTSTNALFPQPHWLYFAS